MSGTKAIQRAGGSAMDRMVCTLFGDGFFVSDGHEPYFQEKLLQAIWNEQLVAEPLRTATGQPLQVVHRGVWNVESGPDFHDGAISLAGEVRRGAIEVHHQPEQWEEHGHHTDAAYTQVVLHVVWRNPRGHREYPLGVPLLVLEDCLSRPLPEIMDSINIAAYPYARQVPPGELAGSIARMSDAFLQDLFESYGIARSLRKAQELCEEILAHGVEQAVYRRLMEAMGYKANREPFVALAMAVPISQLQALPDAQTQLALLMGAGNLLPDPTQEPVLAGWRGWLAELWTAWWPYRGEHYSIARNRQRLRPYNAPERRLLAAWIILQRQQWRLGEVLLRIMRQEAEPGETLGHLREALATSPEDEPYRTFYSFCREMDKPAALLGDARVNDLIVNLAIPLYFADCFLRGEPQRCRAGRRLLCSMPRLQGNRLLTEAAHHLFAPPARARKILTNACAQQGMLKLHRDWGCT